MQMVTAGVRGFFVAMLAAGSCAGAASAPAPVPTPVVATDVPMKFMPSLSDEFDGDALDTQKWDADMPDWGRWSWEPGNVSVRDGALFLTIRYSPHERKGERLHYTSGAVRSRAAPLLYGYIEARFRAAPRYPGVSTAFWAFRNTPALWTEIDVVETTQHWSDPDILYFNTHVLRSASLKGAGPLHEKRTADLGFDPGQESHVYSCLWSDRELVWFVDGREVARRSNDHWQQPLDVVLSVALRPPLDKVANPRGFPATARVEYVRVWSLVGPAPGRN
jgi:beta-glucanase (GH16 family)